MKLVAIEARLVMSSGNWMMGQVVFLKTQSTETASQKAFHSAHLFQGGVGTVAGSRLPPTWIAPPIQMICSIFELTAGEKVRAGRPVIRRRVIMATIKAVAGPNWRDTFNELEMQFFGIAAPDWRLKSREKIIDIHETYDI